MPRREEALLDVVVIAAAAAAVSAMPDETKADILAPALPVEEKVVSGVAGGRFPAGFGGLVIVEDAAAVGIDPDVMVIKRYP